MPAENCASLVDIAEIAFRFTIAPEKPERLRHKTCEFVWVCSASISPVAFSRNVTADTLRYVLWRSSSYSATCILPAGMYYLRATPLLPATVPTLGSSPAHPARGLLFRNGRPRANDRVSC